ncbi:hypothetical protein [Stieleria mannarensis]|uniref:hypothetical protein n=1 Tax=Stieleria mannarensis TaxID=2755585 RepID=UPI001600CE80|nr:hypothetical protein [Rhodopirellula sp. JC639]
MKRLVGCALALALIHGSAVADDWSPDDDTYDPTIQSVVIGDRSWIGDPSPFVHLGLSRTGYTYVAPVAYDGFDPSVQLSLMVPTKPGETTPPAGGMLMLNQTQATRLIKAFEAGLKAEPNDKDQRIPIKTAMQQADWALTFSADQNQRFLQLEHRSKDKVDTYRLTTNASKKLLGAIKHSLKKLEEKAAGEASR